MTTRHSHSHSRVTLLLRIALLFFAALFAPSINYAEHHAPPAKTALMASEAAGTENTPSNGTGAAKGCATGAAIGTALAPGIGTVLGCVAVGIWGWFW